jgi:hypothetical protein
MMEVVSTPETSVSTRLHGATSQKTVIFGTKLLFEVDILRSVKECKDDYSHFGALNKRGVFCHLLENISSSDSYRNGPQLLWKFNEIGGVFSNSI